MEERASDQDREQAAEQIRDHYAAGRLTDDELDKRVQAAYAPKRTPSSSACSPICPSSPRCESARSAPNSSSVARTCSGGCTPAGRRERDRVRRLHGDLDRVRSERLVLADLGRAARGHRPAQERVGSLRPGTRSRRRRGATRPKARPERSTRISAAWTAMTAATSAGLTGRIDAIAADSVAATVALHGHRPLRAAIPAPRGNP